MAKIGDTVRYLNATGGGKIVRIDGKVAYVEDDGFEMPVLLKDLVVVLPAGAIRESLATPKLAFDQKTYDMGRISEPAPKLSKELPPPDAIAPPQPKPVQTPHGDKINLLLAFEPSDLRKLGNCSYNAVLVNDSNYELHFIFATRPSQQRRWNVAYGGSVLPNELIDLAQYATQELVEIENVAIQYIAFKNHEPFELQSPGSISRKLDLTKFYKLHCFRKGIYFDTPVLEVPLVADGEAVKMLHLTPPPIEAAQEYAESDKKMMSGLKEKFRVEKQGKGKTKGSDTRPELNPHKLLPPIEVDLHIHELVETTVGMKNADMLALQLDTVRSTMNAHKKRIGQKIIFIHGKGDGVLRKEVTNLLKREYPKSELQDASFAEYGFGATLVTIH